MPDVNAIGTTLRASVMALARTVGSLSLSVGLSVGLSIGLSVGAHAAGAVATTSTASPPAVDAIATLGPYYFAAARVGDGEVLQEFLRAGFPVNLQNAQSYTALMIAAYNGQPQVVDLLLDAGADACIEDKRGNTALMGAIVKGELRIARRLLEADCDPNHQNRAGQTPAMYATVFGRGELLQALQRRGATLPDSDPLQQAAR